jgi:hypothetical protein
MIDHTALNTAEVSNKCVVICSLREWSRSESPAWKIIEGEQDEIGRCIASMLEESHVERIDDFGGVSKTFLCDGERYREDPRHIKGSAVIVSFTPKNRIISEGQAMAQAAKLAGYKMLIMTVQKEGKFGKVWVLRGVLRQWSGSTLLYYEDTNSIIDELKASPEGEKILAVHVQVAEYEGNFAQLADREVSQAEYQLEVLKEY